MTGPKVIDRWHDGATEYRLARGSDGRFLFHCRTAAGKWTKVGGWQPEYSDRYAYFSLAKRLQSIHEGWSVPPPPKSSARLPLRVLLEQIQ